MTIRRRRVLAESKSSQSNLVITNAKWKTVSVVGWSHRVTMLPSGALLLSELNAPSSPAGESACWTFTNPLQTGGNFDIWLRLRDYVRVFDVNDNLMVCSVDDADSQSIAIEPVPGSQPALSRCFRLFSDEQFSSDTARLSRDVPDERRGIAVALADCGVSDAVVLLTCLLADRNEAVRLTAARSLGKTGHEDAARPLLAAQGTSDDLMRQTVSDSLLQLGARYDIVEDLLANTRAPNPYSRKAGVWVLGELHDIRGLTAACAATSDEQDFVRRTAAFALGKFYSLRAFSLLQGLASDDADLGVRDAAATSIQRLKKLDV